jgi:hypothetical protein
LVGKESVVRTHLQLVAACHRLGEDEAADAAGGVRRDAFVEEEPRVRAIAGPGAFESHWKSESVARLREREYVVLPPLVVEVRGERPAQITFEHRGDAHHVMALQMLEHAPIVDGDTRLVRAFPALDPRLLAGAAHPLVRARRRVTLLLGLRVLPVLREDICASAEWPPEQRHLFGRRRRGRRRRGRFYWCCDRKAPLGRVVQLSNFLTERVDANAQRKRFLREGVEARFAAPELLLQLLA